MTLSAVLITFVVLFHLSVGEVRWLSPTPLGTADGTSPENASSDMTEMFFRPGQNITIYFLPGDYVPPGNFPLVYFNQSLTLVSTQLHAARIGQLSGAVVRLETAAGTYTEYHGFSFIGNTRLVSFGRMVIRDSQLIAENVSFLNGTGEIRNCRLEPRFRTEEIHVRAGMTTQGLTTVLDIYDSHFFPNTLPQATALALQIRDGSHLNMGGNTFYSSLLTNCDPGTITLTSPNSYCGKLTPLNCPSRWPETITMTYNDGCGICGKRDNAYKDCEGTCWGIATSCPAPKEIFVSVEGGGDGSPDSPATFSPSLMNSANYKDTIVFYPGVYSNLNMTIPGSKGLTLSSLASDPTTVIWEHARFETNGTSFDTIFRGITFTGLSHVWVNTTETIKFEKCIWHNVTGNTYLPIGLYGGGFWFSETVFQHNDALVDSTKAIIRAIPQQVTNRRVTTFLADNIVSRQNKQTLLNFAWNMAHIEVHNWTSVDNVGTINLGPADMFFIPQGSYHLFIDGFYSTNATTGRVGQKRSMTCLSFAPGVYSFKNVRFCDSVNGLDAVSCFNMTSPAGTGIDSCRVCQGSNQHKDCADQCFGYSEFDPEGQCCAPSLMDCNGICDGEAEFDEYGVCQELPGVSGI